VEHNTATKSDTCLSCYRKIKTNSKIEAEKSQILNLYGNVEGPTFNKHSQRCYTFVHTCGTKQTWSFGNLLKQLKARPDKVPCSKCGAAERQEKSMAAYMKIFGRDWNNINVEDWEAYSLSVRRLTEITYKKHKSIINPLGLKRGVNTYHLDHIVPIVECFKRGWPPEQAADLSNLQMLEAKANLSKGRTPK
jgi:hypothetical protein